jgi:hypothetical protein
MDYTWVLREDLLNWLEKQIAHENDGWKNSKRLSDRNYHFARQNAFEKALRTFTIEEDNRANPICRICGEEGHSWQRCGND